MTHPAPLVLSIVDIRTVCAIDAGNTIAARLVGADGREVVLVLPTAVAGMVCEQIATGLGLAAEARGRWTGPRIGADQP